MRLKFCALSSLAVMLAGLCFYRAWAGYDFYRGERLYQAGRFEAALARIDRGLARDKSDPKARMNQGLARWALWQKTQDPAMLEAAHASFREASVRVPVWGRPRFYAALSAKAQIRFQDRAGEEDKQNVKRLFKEARALEPGSPWMAVHTALQLLDGPAALTEKEYKHEIKRLRWALGRHYPDQASAHLKRVYEELWQMNLRQEVQTVTPKNVMAYAQLAEFLKSKQQWPAWRNAAAEAELLQQELYRERCDQAEDWLEAGQIARAAAAYRSADAGLPENYRAKAGLLAARKTHGNFSLQENKWLQDALLRDEEELGFYWQRLQGVLPELPDAFLRGLLAFRLGDFSHAVREFEQAQEAENRELKRFLVQSYLETGNDLKAAALLRPLLDADGPDLRELLLMEQLPGFLDAETAERYQRQVERSTTRSLKADQWTRKENMAGAAVNLQPGRLRIRILLKAASEASGRPALVKLRLWDGDRTQSAGLAAVTSVRWQPFTWEIETTGGWRWLQLETLGPETAVCGPARLVDLA